MSEANGNSLDSLVLPPVLDATCGSRAMWFDKADKRAVFFDRRDEDLPLPKGKAWPNGGTLRVRPDVQGDFRKMPFPDESFRLVVFDPPHMMKTEDGSNICKFYGRLLPDWEGDLAAAFGECFRVLKDNGVLVFKWCSIEIPVVRVIALAPIPPLFGHTSGKRQQTHWMTFLKQNSDLGRNDT